MQTITTEELRQFIAHHTDGAVINVLDESSYDAKHIPGSINVPLSEPDFTDQVERRAAGKDAPIVVYCASEDCNASEKAARQLRSAGFTDVRDYTLGVQGWEIEGYQLQGDNAHAG
ncbi:MAG: rhodanese-like domain-containing protein [bacterium]|nr:rhodanese-like domain-containing protein [bacterium]